ncbi:HAD domain-containing protein [Catenuloplanes indicus]|uniref:Uncharacterized protein n=1 Tax=Catenuloplanes indicus TaxID=137267 RepID=A0AAE3VU99_9ACTN|nr:HAD domain-containing protein [Catenuloplanes indicus]MDQ0363397.1 hypothetical protein [Catenuloplanes indicus]
MTTRPVWLLDVDGVINAWDADWGTGPTKTRVDRLNIRWAPELAARIRAVAPAVDIVWATTWCGFPDQLTALGQMLGLEGLPSAFDGRPLSKTWADQKLEAALRVLDGGRRLIWTDDTEVQAAADLYPQIAAAARDRRALLIEPDGRRGLRPAHLDAIEAFTRPLTTTTTASTEESR